MPNKKNSGVETPTVNSVVIFKLFRVTVHSETSKLKLSSLLITAPSVSDAEEKALTIVKKIYSKVSDLFPVVTCIKWVDWSLKKIYRDHGIK